MKALRFIMTGILVAGTTFIVAETLPNRGPLPFSTYDVDNNNVITKKEFDGVKNQRMTQKAQAGTMMRNAGNSPVFSDVDSDGDGIITRQELKVHQQNRFNQRINQQKRPKAMMGQGMGKGMGQGKGQNW